MKEFDELLQIMHRLRKECPWDKEQSLQSLRRYLLEEAYECVGAMDEIDTQGIEPLIDELGDVLLQVVFQAELLGEPLKVSVIQNIISNLNQKLIRRHPHIFSNEKAQSSDQVLKRWDEIKKSEKTTEGPSSHLDGISKGLTALQRAQKLGDRSKRVQFDWQNPEQVWAQVESELKELRDVSSGDREELEHELGDVFFSLVQWARHKNIDAETILAKANQRFVSRFMSMEEISKNNGQEFEKLSLEQKEQLWNQAKQKSGAIKP